MQEGLLAIPSAGINEVLDFPFLVDSHQLKRVGSAVPEFSVEIKLVRRPHTGEIAIYPYRSHGNSFIRHSWRLLAYKISKFRHSFVDHLYLALAVFCNSLKNGA